MDVTAPSIQSNPQAPALQTSQQQGEKNKKPFDPQALKEEKVAMEAAREALPKASTASSSAGDMPAVADSRVQSAAVDSNQARQVAEWSRDGGSPNWSSLSAASKGYTMTERAINLYRHISAMPV